jgi:Sortase domain
MRTETTGAHVARRVRLAALALAVFTWTGCGAKADDPADLGQPVPAEDPTEASESAAVEQSTSPEPTDDGDAGTGNAAASSVTGEPTSLQFAGTTSPVVSVGNDSARNLEIPGDLNTLGWWRDGAEAGAREGFVVITGHATQDGTAAANLWWSAEPGDTIVVETDEGSLTYRVVSRTTYDVDEVPLGRWFPTDGPSGPPALALITCSDYRDGEWRANTVVEAVPA